MSASLLASVSGAVVLAVFAPHLLTIVGVTWAHDPNINMTCNKTTVP